jgi:hypothetical protein
MKSKLFNATNIFLAVAWLISACGGDETKDNSSSTTPDTSSVGSTSSPSVGSSQQSECKNDTKADKYDAAPDGLGTLVAKAEGNTLIIIHQDAIYNCASKVRMDATVDGNKVTINEVITNPDEYVYCICPYDISISIDKLADGKYTIELFNANNQLVGNSEVQIGQNATSAEVGTTKQSDCKGENKAEEFDGYPSGLGTLIAEAQGNTLIITHQNAPYNCASKIRMEAILSGNKVSVHEVITNPDELMDCMCPYDISISIDKLADGKYTIELFNTNNELVGNFEVQIGQN